VEVLYLSPCAPLRHGRGVQKRAYQELTVLAGRFRVHLSCFARSEQEMEEARRLLDRCASVYAAPLFPFPLHLARAGFRFLLGASLNDALHWSGRFSKDLLELIESRPLAGAVAYTAVMGAFVPAGMPFVLDLADAASEEWRAHARHRKPSFLFQTEAKRLVELETREARRAGLTLLSTAAGRDALLRKDPQLRCEVMEDGVDFDDFDPAACPEDASLAARRYLLFCGALDSHANEQGIVQFARNVFPRLRGRDPGLELLIAGRRPGPRVLALSATPGVEVAGTVEDVRPYYRHALATVVPLQTALGIPDMLLESLAMNRPVLASPAVCETFGGRLPEGVRCCASPEEYSSPVASGDFRRSARARFTWKKNLAVLERAVAELGRRA